MKKLFQLSALAGFCFLLISCKQDCPEPPKDDGTKATMEANKKLAAGIFDVFNTGNTEGIEKIIAADMKENTPDPNDPCPDKVGPDKFKCIVASYRGSFPDVKVVAKVTVAEGDMVVVWGEWSGTNTGEMMGMPPTGKSVTQPFVDMFKCKDGKITEHWGIADNLAFMTQLGMIPPMGEEAPKDAKKKGK